MEKLYAISVIVLLLSAINAGLLMGNVYVLFRIYDNIKRRIDNINFKQKNSNGI